ncbi:haloacid dehalogenase type II [Streptomyces sp. DSM 41982]|uniref:Haloacid dehalogenase type II n=1 Tax=Streptomyces evansiae TaxID=3075535 RepID=A0ABD5E1I2_9ACTN|nr:MULTISPECIES: haloacid dehalogenase type II [unclassified Streptomyces]MDT0415296.1 haloacid dehalogenase type II [Streptomyces sp. DSM 41982]SCD44493.1 2-haloacid dehalogenase [Streptomyces sp. SolWspMP-sol7th]
MKGRKPGTLDAMADHEIDAARDIDVLVFDVLGTLVDDVAGIRTGIGELTTDAAEAERLFALWQEHTDTEQRRMMAGQRPYLPADALDMETAGVVAAAAGLDDDVAAVAALARTAHALAPFPDSVAGLDRLARRFPLIALSNASRAELLGITVRAGLRWHLALSTEEARTFKPDPPAYELALAAAGRPPERVLMVAAHAWDLRGAQSLGMRTAYVHRDEREAPGPDDRFDVTAADFTELADRLLG